MLRLLGATATATALMLATAQATCTTPAVNSDMTCYQRPSTVIGSLPACNSGAQGLMYFVTDALLPVALATVGAGGAVKVGVTCNGTAWIVQ